MIISKYIEIKNSYVNGHTTMYSPRYKHFFYIYFDSCAKSIKEVLKIFCLPLNIANVKHLPN